MRAYIDERSMGAGKTYDAIERLITCKCKALFITERIESFDEVESTISKASIRLGVKPIVRRIHAGDLQWSNSVSREIEELPDFFRHADHVIVIASHQAMLRSNLGDFHGWRIVIDEVPQLLDFENLRTHLDADFFETHYQLAAFDEGWSSVTLTKAGDDIIVKLAPGMTTFIDGINNLATEFPLATEGALGFLAALIAFQGVATGDGDAVVGERGRNDGCRVQGLDGVALG